MLRALLFCLLGGCLASCTPKPVATQRKGLIIPITDSLFIAGGMDTVRFGRLRSGEIAVLRLCFANDATRPAVLVAYERSCGCTTLELDSQPIVPGDARHASLTFDSRGERGWQLKLLRLNFAGAQAPLKLFVEAEIE